MRTVPDVAVQVVSTGDAVLGNTGTIANGFKTVAGVQAFRSYNWLTDSRMLNTAGNFRGMVVSARWGTAYNVVSKAGDELGTIAAVVSIGHNLLTMAPQFELVFKSNDDALVKSLRYISLTGTVAQKTLAGMVTGPVHLLAGAVMLSCTGLSSAGLGKQFTHDSNAISQKVKSLDAKVDYYSDFVTDNARQLRVIATGMEAIQRVVTVVIP